MKTELNSACEGSKEMLTRKWKLQWRPLLSRTGVFQMYFSPLRNLYKTLWGFLM